MLINNKRIIKLVTFIKAREGFEYVGGSGNENWAAITSLKTKIWHKFRMLCMRLAVKLK